SGCPRGWGGPAAGGSTTPWEGCSFRHHRPWPGRGKPRSLRRPAGRPGRTGRTVGVRPPHRARGGRGGSCSGCGQGAAVWAVIRAHCFLARGKGSGERGGPCPSACGWSAVGAEGAPLAAGAQPGGAHADAVAVVRIEVKDGGAAVGAPVGL